MSGKIQDPSQTNHKNQMETVELKNKKIHSISLYREKYKQTWRKMNKILQLDKQKKEKNNEQSPREPQGPLILVLINIKSSNISVIGVIERMMKKKILTCSQNFSNINLQTEDQWTANKMTSR